MLAAASAAGPRENLPSDCVVVNHFDFAALRKSAVWGRVAKPIDEFLSGVRARRKAFAQKKGKRVSKRLG